MTYEELKQKYQPYLDYKAEYAKVKNAATGSKVDANANVNQKNIATLSNELTKTDIIGMNRLITCNRLTEMFGEEVAQRYLDQLDQHLIYRHDESHILPYCVSITMYPFLFNGLETLGGSSKAPKHLSSFCGEFVNLVFAVAAQFAGAVSTPEFLSYMDYFLRKDYGDDYYLNPDKVVDLSNRHLTIDNIISDSFQQVVYSINQPAAARGNQAVFWNIAYFDHPYFDGMFSDFVFPDGSAMKWESVSWLQKRFMNWFNEERLRVPITFPVETLDLLDDGEKYVDEEWADFAAEMWSKGHSFFMYRSNSVDSLSSCCRLRNELQDNTFSYTLGAGGVSTGSKCVITMNINRLVQNAKRDGVPISDAVRKQTQDIHQYLLAVNEAIKEDFQNHMLTAYDAGYISLDKQYLTVGVNGFVEGAEFLGIPVQADSEEYAEYCNSILEPIYNLNKAARTKEIMTNCEFVPRH